MAVKPLTENIDKMLNDIIQFYREKGRRVEVADYLENTRKDIDSFLDNGGGEK